MSLHRRRTGRLSALTLAGLISLTGCGNADSAPVPTTQMHTRNDTGPVVTPLRAALVTAADLPSAYKAFTPKVVDETPSADRQSCYDMLQQLEVKDTTVPGAQQVVADFEADPQGAVELQHLIRSYPGQGAAQQYARAVSTLGSCPTLKITYANGSVIQETLTPGALPGIQAPSGVQTWTTAVEVNFGGGMVLHQVTVLMQTRDRLAVLTFVNPDPISTSWATQLSDTLASRLAG
ncbi:MAG TPA: hypothetical protein VFP72_10380 [Kineosporiaceae bacterium]|nr:hypothetical protein [Kineosporiaceae bacterium]